MQTQNERLLAYLTTHKSIDPLTAWAELGIYRTGARIFDLKKAGNIIISGTCKVTNRFGEQCRVANYRLGTP